MALPAFDLALALSPQGLRAVSELLVVAPAAALSLIPVWGWRRVGRIRLALELALALALDVLAALVVAGLSWPTNYLLVPACGVLFLAYCNAFDLSLAQKATVFLTMMALGAFITYFAIIADVYAGTVPDSPYLGTGGVVTQWALWVVALALLVRPLHTAVPSLIGSPAVGPRFWTLAWVLPCAVVVVLVLAIPADLTTLFYRDVGPNLMLITLTVLALFLLTYALMYRLIRKADEALAASEDERRATMQRLMEEHLSERIETARRARHDVRQHDLVVLGYLEEGDLEGLRAYLSERDVMSGTAPLSVCEDVAVNSVAIYYWDRALEAGAKEVTMELEVPRLSARREGNVTVVLGNLLENAVDSLGQLGGGVLRVRVRMEQGGTIFIAIDNSCSPNTVVPQPGQVGGVPSTKHFGMGLGMQSVITTAEASGGTAEFACEGGMFYASVMLCS